MVIKYTENVTRREEYRNASTLSVAYNLLGEEEVNIPNVGYNPWTGRATLYTAK